MGDKEKGGEARRQEKLRGEKGEEERVDIDRSRNERPHGPSRKM